MATPAVAVLSERERAALELITRWLDMVAERKPMGAAPEPEPAAATEYNVIRMERTA